MKSIGATPHLLVALVIVVLAALAQPGAAIAAQTTIVNVGATRVKVCAYRTTDRARLVALQCWLLSPNMAATWTHGNDTARFNVVVYDPGIVDGFLCEVLGASTNVFVTAKPCRISATDPRRPPAVTALLRVCNRGVLEDVSFVLAYAAGRGAAPDGVQRTYYASEGWWIVSNGQCVSINLNDRVSPEFLQTAASYPDSADIRIYGKTSGILFKAWEGSRSEPSFCVSNDNAFQLSQWLTPKVQCAASGAGWVRPSRIDPPRRVGRNALEFSWNF